MLIDDIKEVQESLGSEPPFDTSKEKVYDMTLRFARFMPSPSKLNAVSVLKSNSAEHLAAWLENEEKAFEERYK